MNQDILQLIIFGFQLNIIRCSNLGSVNSSYPGYCYALNLDTGATSYFGHQEADSTDIQGNEFQNIGQRTIDEFKIYEQTYKYVFNENATDQVKFERLFKTINLIWSSHGHNTSKEFRTMLSNKDDMAITNHFVSLKNELSVLTSAIKQSTKGLVDIGRKKATNEEIHNIVQEYNNITCKNTIAEYVIEMQNIFSMLSFVETKSNYLKAIKKFFVLIGKFINIENYANPVSAGEISTNEIREFICVCARFKYRIFKNCFGSHHFSYDLTRLFVNSLHMFYETRVREKCLFLPEFVCLNDYFKKFYAINPRVTNLDKVIATYIISKIEILVSRLVVVNNEIVSMQDTRQESVQKIMSYRSFMREVLVSNHLLLLRVKSLHISKYIWLSQLEYSYLYMNASSCSDTVGDQVGNFYDILFFVFSTFYTSLDFSQNIFSKKWGKDINTKYINNNAIFIRMLSQQPSDFKVALRGSIEKIFSTKISTLAEFQKLKAVMCDHVDRLDEKNPVLMSLKASDIYKFIKCYLLERT